MLSKIALISLVPFVAAQQAAWAQCGGNGFTGATGCVSGYTCARSNDYYSQCVPGSATTLATSTLAATKVPAPAATGTSVNTAFVARGKKYFGTATDQGRLTSGSAPIVQADFGQVTPENSMKWDATERTLPYT